jgi:hypothetical protein
MECSIRRLTNDESSKYISTKLGKAISIRHIERIRKQTRQETREWISNLANQGDYVVEYKNRIAEIEKMQQEMWATYRLGQTNLNIRIRCIQTLHELTITLANLYEILPAISDYHYHVPAAPTSNIPLPFYNQNHHQKDSGSMS